MRGHEHLIVNLIINLNPIHANFSMFCFKESLIRAALLIKALQTKGQRSINYTE